MAFDMNTLYQWWSVVSALGNPRAWQDQVEATYNVVQAALDLESGTTTPEGLDAWRDAMRHAMDVVRSMAKGWARNAQLEDALVLQGFADTRVQLMGESVHRVASRMRAAVGGVA